MEELVFKLGTIVRTINDNTVGGYNYRKGELYRITNLAGQTAGNIGNGGNYYNGNKLTKGYKNTSTQTRLLHRDLEPLQRDQSMYKIFLKTSLTSAIHKKELIEKELEFYDKYEDWEQYHATKIKEILDKGGEIEDVRKYLKSAIDITLKDDKEFLLDW